MASLVFAAGLLMADDVNVSCKSDPANDATILNNAISGSHAGDDIHIHGICLANSTIVFLSYRTYQGDNRGNGNDSTGTYYSTMIRQANGANLEALVAPQSWAANLNSIDSNIRITHLTLDGNKANNSGGTHGLVLRTWLSVAEDLYIKNTGGDGIQLTNTTQNGTATTSSQVNGRISHCFIDEPSGNGIHVTGSGNKITDWDLLENQVNGTTGQSAIYLENAAVWRISGNHVYGVQQHAIYAGQCFGTTIDSNYIENFGGAGGSTNTWYGIACTLQGSVASVISGNKNVHV